MASSGSRLQLDDVRQTVTCGICLQLLSDPRALTCGHIYCLPCLKGFQTSSSKKECPVCRATTVPQRDLLDGLPVNKLASDLVKLVHTHEPSSQEPPADWASTRQSSSQAEAEHVDAAERFATMLALLRDMRTRDDDDDVSEPGNEQPRHRCITCDNCRRNNITGHRYKCGICEDYDLCERCEALPRADVHDVEHIFIKLKKPRTTRPAYRRVLHEDSTVMGMTQDFSNTRHVLQISGSRKVAFNCDKCKTSPIVGTRYKCGLQQCCIICCRICDDYDLCEECEKTSPNFHDPKHIFLVLKHPVGFHTAVPQLTYKFYR